MPELKPGWRRVKFGEVVRQVKEKADPATSGLERFVAGEHMDTDDLRIRRWGDIGDGYLGPAFHARFRPGQVLYGSRRTYLRKVAVADFDGICANTTFVLEPQDPKVLLPELLPFIMQTEAFHEHSKRESKGSVNPYVNFSDLAWYEFVLPPLEEQRRFTGLLAGITATLESITQAITSSGTALRAASRQFFESGFEGSPVVSFGAAVDVLDPNPSHRYPEYVDDGVPLVSTQNFDDTDGYTFVKARNVPQATWEEQNGRCSFNPDDVVFARKGVLGLARRYGHERKAFSHTVVILKPRDGLMSPDYLLWLVRSDRFMSVIRRAMNTNSGVPTLGVKTIESVPVPVPEMASQVAASEALHRLDKVKATLQAREAGLRAIRSRILEQLQSDGQAQ